MIIVLGSGDPSGLLTMVSMPGSHSVLNVKVVVAAFNQEKALVGPSP